MLDAYLSKIKLCSLKQESFRKTTVVGYKEKVLSMTMRREQNAMLRQIAERTGKSISELIREVGVWGS